MSRFPQEEMRALPFDIFWASIITLRVTLDMRCTFELLFNFFGRKYPQQKKRIMIKQCLVGFVLIRWFCFNQ